MLSPKQTIRCSSARREERLSHLLHAAQYPAGLARVALVPVALGCVAAIFLNDATSQLRRHLNSHPKLQCFARSQTIVHVRGSYRRCNFSLTKALHRGKAPACPPSGKYSENISFYRPVPSQFETRCSTSPARDLWTPTVATGVASKSLLSMENGVHLAPVMAASEVLSARAFLFRTETKGSC